MSLLRPLPPGADHLLSDEGMRFLPAFVRARLQYLAETLDWLPEEEEEEVFFTSHEVKGTLSHGSYSLPPQRYVSPIHIWIASDDECFRSLSIGGSTWICPDNHYLYFDAIDPALLPEKPDPDSWWCIHYKEGIKVIKILVRPAEAITEEFPDGV